MRDFVKQIGLSNRDSSQLVLSRDDLLKQPATGVSYATWRIWREMHLDGILNVDGRPAVYFKSQRRFRRPQCCKQQNLFWNHGGAPILVLVDEKTIRAYSGMRPPTKNTDEVDDDGRLIGVFDRIGEMLQFRWFLQSVESNQIYGQEEYRKSFDPNGTVDRNLLRNLHAARDLLSSDDLKVSLELPIVHRLLTRMIFIYYLEARKVLNGDIFGWLGAGATAKFNKILRLDCAKEQLFKLFRRLRKDFGGSVFDGEDINEEDSLVTSEHIEVLRRLFVEQEELDMQQQTLDFDLYDFSVIPIETISAIYEDFLSAEDSAEKRKTGAYYTPPKLVELIMDLATEDESDLLEKRILDPSCGSGAFLVGAFNRIAEEWRRLHPRSRNGTKIRELSRILREQITGVDINLTACRITCFSLHLAMLDFLSPRDIKGLRDKGGLPPLLQRKYVASHGNSPRTIIEGDFLSFPSPLHQRKFDLIVGNPPWTSRKVDSSLEDWKRRNKNHKVPANQTAVAFMWQVGEFLDIDGTACLLLPSGVFCGNNTSDFQREWFRLNSVDKILHLPDLRKFLFDSSTNPATGIRFQRRKSTSQHETIDFMAPKAGLSEMRGDRISVLPEDRKTIDLSEFMEYAKKGESPLFWMKLNWATPRDSRLLCRLQALPTLGDRAGSYGSGKKWVKGQGLQPSGVGEASNPIYEPYWNAGTPFLSAKSNFSFVLDQGDCEDIPKLLDHKLRRLPKKEVFQSPLVVFNQGFSKIAYSPFTVIFRHAIQSISGPTRDRHLLKFLAVVLNSSLAGYFLFHCSGKSWYRNPFFADVMRLPFPLPDDAPSCRAQTVLRSAVQIIDKLSEQMSQSNLRDDSSVEEAKHKRMNWSTNILMWRHGRGFSLRIL